MAGHLLPCRYCDAPTYMADFGSDAVQIKNPDGTLHHCHEADRANAIHTIFWGQVEDACQPLTPEEVVVKLGSLYDYLANSCVANDDNELYAVGAAIEMVKLAVGAKPF